MNICALIPSYNEAKTIADLVRKVKDYGLDPVVIDDGSSDATTSLSRDAGAFVIKHASNQGKGASLKAGFRYALDKDYAAVITMDADGQHCPSDLPQFIQAANSASIDIVAGNRMTATKNMPLVRWLTNYMMSFFISIFCWRNIPDSQCGYRLIKKQALKKLDLISDNYEIESESLIAACRKGLHIKFIPIQTIYARQQSQIHPVIDTMRFLKLLIKVYCPYLFNKR